MLPGTLKHHLNDNLQAVARIDGSEQVKLFLDQFSIRSAVLNAELPRNSRLHTVREFNRGHVEYIIATDEALKAVADADTAAASAADDGDEEDTGSSKKQKGKKTISKDKECAKLLLTLHRTVHRLLLLLRPLLLLLLF